MNTEMQEKMEAILGTPDMTLTPVTSEEIMSNPMFSIDVDYNRKEAKKTLDGFEALGAKFYHRMGHSYREFFVEYPLDGFRIFKSMGLHHSSMHNGGYRRAHIIENDEVAHVWFEDFGGHRAKNCPENRRNFSKWGLRVTDL